MKRISIITKTRGALKLFALGLAASAAFLAGTARAQTDINSGNSPYLVTDDPPTGFWSTAGDITIENDATLQIAPNDQGSYNGASAIANALIFGGSGGTINLQFNLNDTIFEFSGPITSTATGGQSLAIVTGYAGNGDREEVTFDSAIPDNGDASPLGVQVTFNCQSGSYSYVNLPAANTFTGPITLVKGNNVNFGYLTIGGVGASAGGNSYASTPGSGSLGGGNYAGNISLDTATILDYSSSADQTLSGAISGAGAVIKEGSSTLTLSGPNTYSGNTTVSGGTLVLDAAGSLNFVVTDASANKVTGGGTATLNGSFTIDTSAVTGLSGSWTLVDVATPSYGGTFSVTGFTGPGPVWTETVGSSTWTFDQTSGVLSLASKAVITSFGIPGAAGVIDNSTLTISLVVPPCTDVTHLAPTFTLSSGSCVPASGSTQDFSSPVTYTVTDGATVNNYVVTATVATTTTVVFNLGAPGSGTVILNGLNSPPEIAAGTLPVGSILRSVRGQIRLDDDLGSGSWASDFNFVVNGLLRIGDDGDNAWGGANNINWHGQGQNGNGTSFDETMVAGVDFPDTIDLNAADVDFAGGYGNAKFSGTVTVTYDLVTTDVKQITSFTFPPYGQATISGTSITMTVPPGTDVTALSPTYTFCGASCSPASGSSQNFSSPVTYTVTAADSTTQDYTVTVSVAPWINVNLDDTTRSGLVGPAGGLGNTWNQTPATSGSSLLDYSGTGTSVGYTTGGTSWGGPDSWGTPTLLLLTEGLRNFDTSPANSQYLVINNLPYRKFNVFIASANCSGQLSQGTWSTPNTTTTVGAQTCDNTGGINGDTWVQGNNYALFANVVPDDSGNITVNGQSTGGYRLPLNGFQLVDAGAAPPRTGKVMSNVFFPGLGYAYAADSTGTNLVLQVPFATVVTALAPTYTVSLGATGNPVSGTSQDFTTKQTYIITAEDLSQQAYSVTVAPVGAGLGYSALVEATGPVAFWPLGELTGTTAVDVVGGHNATYSGTYTLGVAGLAPRTSGAAVDFVAGTATAPYSAALNPTQFSIECWVRPHDTTVQYLVSLQDRTAGGRIGYAIWKNNGSAGFGVMAGVSTANNGVSVNGATVAAAGNSYHVVGTYDGTTLTLYVNGNLEGSTVTTYMPATSSQPGFTIGSRNGVTEANSDIQYVAVYNRALTQQEVLTHYQNAPILKVGYSSGQVILTWEPDIVLQHAAPDVTGPYTDVPAATSPWPITPSAGQEFWRLKVQ